MMKETEDKRHGGRMELRTMMKETEHKHKLMKMNGCFYSIILFAKSRREANTMMSVGI